MAQSKASLIARGGISHQQGLVQALQPNRVKLVKRTIPGGSTMYGVLDRDTFKSAVYNWLRGTRHFSQVTISMAKDPDQYSLSQQKLVDFDDSHPHPAWMTHPDGKLWLAEIMSEALVTHQVVTLIAQKDGLWMTTDRSGKLAPTRPASKEDVDEALELLAEGEEAPFGIGDPIPNEEWEPYIEFVPQRKAQYGF